MDQNRYESQDEISLVDCWIVLKKHKKLVMYIIGGMTLLSIVISFILPKYYKSEAVIIPVGSGGSSLSSLAGQLGGLASLAGMGGGLSVQTPAQQLTAILKTRALAESVIDENKLLPILVKNVQEDNIEWAKEVGSFKLVNDRMKFSEDSKTGTIKISAEFEDPKLAAAVVNSYVRSLQRFINNNSITVAKRNRLFIEEQLEINKRELLQAGKDLNEFYKNERVSNIESKLDVPISQKDEQNAALGDLQKQKDEIDKRLNELKILKDVPQQVYLQYLNLKKTLLTQVHSLLTQQYEMAKIQESKEDLSFQLIDPPQVPEVRSKPKRRVIVMISFMSSFFLAAFAAFLLEYISKFRSELRSRS